MCFPTLAIDELIVGIQKNLHAEWALAQLMCRFSKPLVHLPGQLVELRGSISISVLCIMEALNMNTHQWFVQLSLVTTCIRWKREDQKNKTGCARGVGDDRL